MKSQILFCKRCNKYTLKKSCDSCNSKTTNPCPAKYSPLDKYGKYRRLARK